MKREKVSSTSILSVGYDSVNETLEVEFIKGTVYQYLNVPAGQYLALKDASSKGQYFNANIKDSYRYIKIK